MVLMGIFICHKYEADRSGLLSFGLDFTSACE